MGYKLIEMAANLLYRCHGHGSPPLKKFTPSSHWPHFLGRFSLVAFEMAQQLQVQAQKVALLALFDTKGRGHLKRTLLSRSVYHLNKL